MKNKKPQRRNLVPLLAIGAGLLLILGSVAWLVYSSTRGASETGGSSTQAAVDEELPYPEVARVSPGDAKAAYDIGTAVFVDVRGPQDYAQGHIPGALNLPLTELDQRLSELDPEAWIITYCT